MMRRANGARAYKRSRPEKILRFRNAERRVHWSIAIPFLVCYTSALILVVFYNSNPLRPHRDVFSGIHRISGVCLAILPLVALVRNWRDWRLHLSNIKQAWIWTLDDLKWVCLMGLAAISSRFALPEQGKFNAAEKLNFMLVMVFWPILICTGLLIWLPGVQLKAWFVHVGVAVVYTPFLLGHVFMATINPDTRRGLGGMISGFVDREWAKHHYRRWYRENFERARSREGGSFVRLERKQPSPRSGDRVRVYHPGKDARPHVGREPNAPSAAQERLDISDPRVLHTACLLQLRAGHHEAAVRLGRETLEVCLRTGHLTLATGLFRELWPHLSESNVSRELLFVILRVLIQAKDFATASEVYTMLARSEPEISMAVEDLLETARSELRINNARSNAINIYDFLLTHCAESPLADGFREELEKARASRIESVPLGSP